MLSFGDPMPLAEPVLDAGVPLMVQVTSLEEAEQALDVGAGVLVAQGSEAGGHGGRRATLPFVPVVVDLAGSTPVLAAGGIADGRGPRRCARSRRRWCAARHPVAGQCRSDGRPGDRQGATEAEASLLRAGSSIR
jgi:hypothetical protein